MSILDLFCSVDAFWQQFEPLWEREQLTSGRRQRKRATRLSPSEIMTILILFQQSGYRTFKGFYTQQVQNQLHTEFPRLVSYARFVACERHAKDYGVSNGQYGHVEVGEA